MPTAPGAVVRVGPRGVRARRRPARALPGLFELLDGGVSVSRLRQVDISRPAAPRPDRARSPTPGMYLQGQRVLVTGAGGSIGSELCRQVAHARAARLILLGHGENSIFDIDQPAARGAIRRCRSARSSPTSATPTGCARSSPPSSRRSSSTPPRTSTCPLMEEHPEEAITNNVVGTRTLVDVALGAGVERFVLISTDKAVAPTSIMGATKRVAEAHRPPRRGRSTDGPTSPCASATCSAAAAAWCRSSSSRSSAAGRSPSRTPT